MFYSSDTTFIAGTVSDKNGIVPIRDKNYAIAKISMVGYEPQWLPAPLPSSIILHSSSRQLKTVVVKASSPVRLKGSSLVVNVPASPYQYLGSADELLSQLPSVRAHESSYTVFGKGTATIYVNDRKLRDNNELQRLSPKDISQVEIIRNPGAEYDANVPAVIKIRLKRPVDQGWGAQASIYGRTGRRFSDAETVSLTYNTTPVDIFFETANSSTCMNTDQTNISTIYSGNDLWHMASEMPGWKSNYYDYTLTGGMDVRFSSRHRGGTRWTYTNDTSRYGGATDNTMLYNGNSFEKLESETLSQSGFSQINGNVYYAGTFNPHFSLLFNSDFIRRKASNNDQTTESGEKTQTHENRNNGTTDYTLWSGKLTGRYQINKQTEFSFGADGYVITQDRINSNLDNGMIYSQTDLKSQDRNCALFAECNFTLSKLRTTVGLRYEMTKMNYRDELSNELLLYKTYYRLYPNISLSWPAGTVNMSLSYTSKVSRPSFYQLRNGKEYFNRYLTTEGNPLLLPQYTSDISYAVQYKSFNAMIGYQRIRNYIQSINIITGQYPLNVLRRPENMKPYSAIYLNLSYDKRIGAWHPYINAGLTKTFFTIPRNSKAVPSLGKRPYMNLSLENWFYVGPYILFADIRHDMDGYLREYHEYSQTNVQIGIIRYFFKKSLYVSLQANNLFHINEKETSYNSNEVFWKSRYRDNRTITLRIRYKFNYSNKYKGKSSAQSELERM